MVTPVGINCAMATANPLPPSDPVRAALARAPRGEEDMSPEQQAELAAIAADFEAGRLRLVAHADMPKALEEIARAQHA